jgi:hypothetical protein
VRFWNVARSNGQVFDENNKCIEPSTTGLLALWNIEENAGQFFHDVASVKHHAYLGSGFSNDNQDPLWTSNECLEDCCNAHAGFTVSDFTPLAAQWVNFTNTSTGASTYQWSVDNQIVSTSQHLQYSFSMGVFIVRLKVTSQGGCASYYSEAIEVTDNNFSYCGEENNVSPEVQAIEDWENAEPHPSPHPQVKMYDRFGNRYLPNEITIPSQQLRSSGTTNWSCSCGIFELYFDDMFYNRDYGFDDPVLGVNRRAVACRVFEDLSALVNPSGTLTSNLVKIQIKKSEGKAPLESSPTDELDPGVLAVAGPYLIAGYNNGIIDGLAYKTIVSGTNAIANTPGWNSNSYHGSVRVDFELPNFFLNNTNWTATSPSNQMDLYSTLLHESLHILGFFSLIDAENNTNLSKINGTQLYNRFDTYLENTAGTPYIDPITGILNPASTFTGGANCAADVTFNGTSNTNQAVYLPAPWNFSILSHFNCTANNYQGCAINNGYVMNACIAPGEMQRAPNQAEYSTLCDIGYQLSTTYGNPAIGSPANNVPHQTYTSCTPACAVAGIDDNLTSTISVAAGSPVTINSSDFLTNDNNTGGSYNLNTLLTSFGTISNVTSSSFDFTPNATIAGIAMIQYQPTCSNGNNGSSALIFVNVTPIVIPCNLPVSSCNLLCNGDLEQTIYNNSWGVENNIHNFNALYLASGPNIFPNLGSSSDLYDYNSNGTLLSLNGLFLQDVYSAFSNCEPGFGTTVGGVPLPVDFVNGKRKYMGLGVYGATGEHITLSLNQALTPSTINNYRLGFWAFTTCDDIDVRMSLSETPPCPGIGYNSDPWSNIYDPNSAYLPSVSGSTFFNYNSCNSYTVSTNQGLTPSSTFDMGAPVNSSDGWEYFILDFHVSDPNLDEVIFSVSTTGSFMNRYIFIDEITIEPLVPQLTITPTLIGTPCPGNKVIIEYNICSDIPVSGVNLEAQLPLGSGLLYTNAFDFTNGQITGLDLGIGGNPLCTLVQVEIEIPVGASVLTTQSIFMDVTGGTACTSTASSLTTDLNIGVGSPLSISVTPSVTGSVSIGSNFTVDVVVSNTGTTDIQNVVVELPSGLYSVGLNYALTSTTIPSILAGTQYTISAVPVSVSGPCGDAQVCAEVVSGTGACNLPGACSPLLTVVGTSTTSFPIEVENTAHTDATAFTAIAISNNNEIYSVGVFSNDIDFTEGTNTNTLVKSHTCSSILSPFLVKYSSCGFEWAVEIPACNLVNLRTLPDVEVGQNGAIYVSFSFLGSFTINGTTYTSQGDADIAIIKYDPTGTPIWVKTEGGVGKDWVTDIETYYNGTNEEVFIVGSLFGSAPDIVSFSNTTNINYNNLGSFCANCNTSGGITYLASYTDNGMSTTMNWVNSLSNGTTLSGKLSVDAIGNAYVIGATNSSFTFNGSTIGGASTLLNEGSPSAANDDIDLFVLKYNNLGNEIWAEMYGGGRFDGGFFADPGMPFDFDIKCEGTTHVGILFSSLSLSSPIGTQQVYMQNIGTHLLRLNASNGSLDWIHPIAAPSNGTNGAVNPAINLVGNITFHSNLTIQGTDYLVNGNFSLTHPNAPYSTGFTSIDFHGTVVNYTLMSPYPTYNDGYLGAFTTSIDNTGSMQWVNVNTSISPPVNVGNPYGNLINYDIEADNLGNIYTPFSLKGTTTLTGSSNLTGGIYNNQVVVDGFISRIDATTGNYLRPNVNNSNINAQAQDDLTTTGNNNQILERATITTTSNISTKLYPNPTTGKVTLEINSDLENNIVEQIIIYDVTGRKVQEISTKAEQKLFDINLNSQQSGVYFVEMIINQELITKRVILMK